MEYLNQTELETPIEHHSDDPTNTNFVMTYESHLHSAMYRLLHQPAGQIGNPNALYFEDALDPIRDEQDGVSFGVEAS